MSQKAHQFKKQEYTRNQILQVSEDIISKEGIKGLSIRKITNSLDYSPGIIYHYFKNKNEIVETLVKEGYGKILSAINSTEKNEYEPQEEIKESFTNYIKAALKSPEYYKAVMLSDDPSILNKTRVLEKGISEKSSAFKILCENIERGMRKKHYRDLDIELTAQVIWTSTFGLIIRLITENDISKEQQERLIDNHFNILFNGILEKQ